MGGGTAAGGKRLTAEQRDELFLFRWLLGLSFDDLDRRVPDWEREVLRERMEAWLPRILSGGLAEFDASPQASNEPPPVPLSELGIETVMVPAPPPA